MSVSEPILAIPNLLTLLRVPLAVAIWIAPGEPVYAFSIIGAAALSDMADGWFARTMRRRLWERDDPGAYAAGTGIGAVLDPICDKLFVASTLVAVFVAVRPPAALIVLIGLRDILVLPMMLGYKLLPGPWKTHGYDFTAGWLGKLTTVAQFGAIGLAVIEHHWLGPAAFVAAGLGAFAVGSYAARAFQRPA